MSFAIHRIEKYKKTDIYGIQIEAERTVADHIKGRDFTNSDIDWSRTDQNIHLVECDNWNKKINGYFKEYGIKPRSNSVVMVSGVYAVSPEYWADKTIEDVKEYFTACLEFHRKTYGDFIVSAVIHVDEGVKARQMEDGKEVVYPSYHCHISSVPILERKNADGTASYSLSAKDLCGNREDYSRRLDEFADLVSVFGLDRGEKQAETRKHLTKMEYELQQMKIATDKAKCELNIRNRVLEVCKEPVEVKVLSQTKERKNKPAESTILTEDLERLKRQVKTSTDLQKGLAELEKVAKETIMISSSDERVQQLAERVVDKNRHIEQLEIQLEAKTTEYKKLESQHNGLRAQFQQFQETTRQWFSIIRDFLVERKIFQEFEAYYTTRETEQIKEHEREDIGREMK